jgi:hypothetical protein
MSTARPRRLTSSPTSARILEGYTLLPSSPGDSENSMVRPVTLAVRQFLDSAAHNEGRGLAVIPDHQVTMRDLAIPHFRAERRIDRAVRAVCMGIAVLRIDLLNPRASSQRSGSLERVGR